MHSCLLHHNFKVRISCKFLKLFVFYYEIKILSIGDAKRNALIFKMASLFHERSHFSTEIMYSVLPCCNFDVYMNKRVFSILHTSLIHALTERNVPWYYCTLRCDYKNCERLLVVNDTKCRDNKKICSAVVCIFDTKSNTLVCVWSKEEESTRQPPWIASNRAFI